MLIWLSSPLKPWILERRLCKSIVFTLPSLSSLLKIFLFLQRSLAKLFIWHENRISIRISMKLDNKNISLVPVHFLIFHYLSLRFFAELRLCVERISWCKLLKELRGLWLIDRRNLAFVLNWNEFGTVKGKDFGLATIWFENSTAAAGRRHSNRAEIVKKFQSMSLLEGIAATHNIIQLYSEK